MQQAKIVKFCMVGPQSVGKTSIIHQFIYKKFSNKTNSTIGCDFNIKKLSNHRQINLQIWDIAGQQRYMGVSKTYFRGALGFIVVCSTNDTLSIDQALKWKNIIQQSLNSQIHKDIPILLLQNKCDLIDQASPLQIQTKRYLQQLTNKHLFCGFMQCSAKLNKNVQESFEYLLNQVIKRGLIKKQEDLKPERGMEKSIVLKYNSSINTLVNQRSGCC